MRKVGDPKIEILPMFTNESCAGVSVGIYFNGLLFICLPEFDSDRQHFIININSAAFAIGGTVCSLLYLYVCDFLVALVLLFRRLPFLQLQ